LFESILIGAGFAFAAAVQPGPFQAFLLARTVEHGWKRTLPAAFAPLLSDIPIVLLVLLLLTNLSDGILLVLKLAGALLLLYLGVNAFRRAGSFDTGQTSAAARPPRTFIEAVLVNLLNPNPYLSWALVLGPALLEAWNEAPRNGLALLLAFYLTLVVSLALVILLFGAARMLGSRGRRILLQASALILAAVGLYQLATGLLAYFGVRV